MIRVILIRVSAALPIWVLVAVLTFVAIRVVPGDAAEVRLGSEATPEAVAAVRAALGLDDPLHVQFAKWFNGLLRGDAGVSMSSGQSVVAQFAERLPLTLELAVVSLAVALALAIPLGVVSAVRRGGMVDHGVRLFAVLGQAVPNFWIGILILTFLSLQFRWTPPLQYRHLWDDPLHNLQQIAFPALILGYALSASLMRLTRSMMIDVLAQDYIRTARSKGLSEAVITVRHALPNAALPLLTVAGIQVGVLIGGAVIIEQVFTLPGIGRQTYEAIIRRDYPQIQFNVLCLAGVVLLVNIVVDVLYAVVDPRVRNQIG